jgi:DeoR/GlpR family transcriptional regulator of sugar metabolism
MQAAKQAIARAASEHVEPGSSIVLDDSTTALAMLPHLAGVEQLTLVTNFVSIAEAVARMTDASLTLIMSGGAYNPKYHSLGGPLAERALRELRVDRCFLSVAAMDLERGAFHQEMGQAILKRTMLEIADEAILLADHSKFAKRALHRVVGRDAFDRVIVDGDTDPAIVERLRAAGGAVEVAPSLAVEDGR